MDTEPSSIDQGASRGISIPQTAETISRPKRYPPQIAFVSGHMNLTPQQLSEHYFPRLDEALAQGHHFVIGDAAGLDTSALTYLLAQIDKYPDIKQRITVHISRPSQIDKYQSMGMHTECVSEKYQKGDPRARHLNRDARMTRASNYDILWVRTEAEERALYGQKWRPRVSATEMNRLRRLEVDNAAGVRFSSGV